jgi:hypothetical protein
LSGYYDVYVTANAENPTNSNNGCVTVETVYVCIPAGGEKRLTVAVWPSDQPGSGERKPVWVTAVVADPNVTPLTLP